MTREGFEQLKENVKFNKAMKEITELKARAYDIISALEQLQRELQAVNAEIAKQSQEAAERKKNERGNDGSSN